MVDVSTEYVTESGTNESAMERMACRADLGRDDVPAPRVEAHLHGWIMFCGGVDDLDKRIRAMQKAGADTQICAIYALANLGNAILINFDSGAEPMDAVERCDKGDIGGSLQEGATPEQIIAWAQQK